ncbi:MAG TPA: hypothetical protein VGC20_17990, partial [bacterium]
MQRINAAPAGPLSTTPDTIASSLEGGRAYWAEMARRLARHFARAESRQRVSASLQGWLSSAARKHSWQRAEVCGEPTPYGFQDVLHRADWDAEAVRDALRTSVIPHLEDPKG